MNKNKILTVLAISSINISPVFAETIKSDIQVSAKIENTCVVSTRNINFNQYSPMRNIDHEGGGAVYLYCTKNMPIVFSIDGGSSGDISQRTMIGNSGNNDKLKYNISIDGYNIFDSYADFGTGFNVGYTIMGKIPSGQYVKQDTYSDVLTVTVNY